ncbi:hypothetical protein LSM04_005722 [Trypanosoma melophagium]|uniref:uncharacterized protein n=1 Tax=Trypanosoma melophagium TaxID=715481 RepID=UPI00351A69B0|nr:hypothetical protein LSM04_005722 [Trypanosoma melophagium]
MPPNTNVSPLEPSLNDGEIATATSSDRPSWRNRLDAFLAQYAPDRSGKSEELLKKYAGHEDALFCALEAKYGQEPVWVKQCNRARVVAFFVRVDLPLLEEKKVDTMIQSFRGTEENLFFHLQQKYGAEHPLQFPQEPDDISTETFEKVDILTDIPFVEGPELIQPLFPSFVGRAALLWFGRVLHWEQPQPPTLRCAYLTSSHVYVGNSESDTVRCTALEKVESVYINSKRDSSDLQSCLLLKVQREHDLFFAFSSDAEAQHLVMTLASALTQYHFGRRCRVLACSNFTDPGTNINCWRPPTYMSRVVSVAQRPRIRKRSEGSLSVNGNREH